MSRTLIGVLKFIVFLAIGIGLLYLTYRKTDLSAMWEAIRKANPLWVILSAVSGYVAIVSRGLRWRFLLAPIGHHPGRWSAIHSVAFGYFANLGVPRSGEIARCTMLSRAENIPADKLFGTVILERVIDTMMLIPIASAAFLLNARPFTDFFKEVMEARAEGRTEDSSSGVLVIGVIALLLLLLFGVWRMFRHTTLAKRIRIIWSGIYQGLLTIRTLERKSLFVFHTLFIWFNYFLMAWFCFLALPETAELGIPAALFIMVAGGLGMIVPTPGGAGSYHAAIALAFVALATAGAFSVVDPDKARDAGVTYAAVAWTTQTVMMIVMGLIAFGVLAMSTPKKQRS
jgi:glycosyltransferase 2 family protein